MGAYLAQRPATVLLAMGFRNLISRALNRVSHGFGDETHLPGRLEGVDGKLMILASRLFCFSYEENESRMAVGKVLAKVGTTRLKAR